MLVRNVGKYALLVPKKNKIFYSIRKILFTSIYFYHTYENYNTV